MLIFGKVLGQIKTGISERQIGKQIKADKNHAEQYQRQRMRAAQEAAGKPRDKSSKKLKAQHSAHGLTPVINPIGAVTSKRHEAQMAKIFGESDSNFSISTSGIWLRDTLESGKLIIRGDALNAGTASIINPVIYLYHDSIHMKALYKASSMQLTDKGWVLDRASRWQTDGQKTDLGNLLLPTGLDALDLRQSGLRPQSISVYLLPGFIYVLERAGIPASKYRFHLYKTLSVPLLMVGIAMLAARVTLTNVSRGRRSRLFLRGAFLSIVIFIFSYFMQILGSSLQVPMSVAAWTPAIAISLIGAIILARTDES